MKKKRSILLLISLLLGLAYLVYLISYFSGASADSSGGAIASVLVLPHMVCVALAVLFNGLGYALNRRGFALTGAILYTVSIVLFVPYFMFVLIEMILSYVGFAKLKES